MKVQTVICDERSYYSNEDTILTEIRISKDDPGAELALEIKSVDVRLECEGIAVGSDNNTERFKYFSTPRETLELLREEADVVTYRSELRFPAEGHMPPSTLHFDDVRDGIEWFVRTEVVTARGDTVSNKRTCTFMQSGPLPNLLSLVDTEHAEVVDGVQVDIITSHATAGLPQLPLSAGIGLCIEASRPDVLAIKRLRLLLLDTTEVNIGDQHKFLPMHRWLLSSTSFKPSLSLSKSTNLDQYTRDVQIDHATLAQTFECDEFAHSFDLAVEVTLESKATNKVRKILSIGPATVLPRIAHLLDADELNRTTSHGSDIAYITDSSDEEESDDDGDADNIEIPVLQVQEPMRKVHSHNSADSSDSVQSIFSDHSKLELDRPEIRIQALSFS